MIKKRITPPDRHLEETPEDIPKTRKEEANLEKDVKYTLVIERAKYKKLKQKAWLNSKYVSDILLEAINDYIEGWTIVEEKVLKETVLQRQEKKYQEKNFENDEQ